MLISTRGRYALRVLIDLAEHTNGGDVPMKDIAERQGISLKYLERIIPVLSKSGIIEGLQGKGGGYRLLIAPEDCKIGDILRLTEGNMLRLPALNVEQNLAKEPINAEHIQCGWSFIRRLTNFLITKLLRIWLKQI